MKKLRILWNKNFTILSTNITKATNSGVAALSGRIQCGVFSRRPDDRSVLEVGDGIGVGRSVVPREYPQPKTIGILGTLGVSSQVD